MNKQRLEFLERKAEEWKNSSSQLSLREYLKLTKAEYLDFMCGYDDSISPEQMNKLNTIKKRVLKIAENFSKSRNSFADNIKWLSSVTNMDNSKVYHPIELSGKNNVMTLSFHIDGVKVFIVYDTTANTYSVSETCIITNYETNPNLGYNRIVYW